MDVVIKILQFLLSFSLLVLVHEFGHYLFARAFGVRVDTFKIFFGKSIFSFKKGDTTWAIGWIPFGGYCKLNGMVDESMDTEFLNNEPQPYEFRSKKAWQRLLIMTGGVMMNLVLAFLIYVGMSWAYGDSYLSTQDMKYGYAFSEQAREMGFRDGDRIISIDGKEYEDFDKMRMSLMLDQKSRVLVDRDGQTVEITIPEGSIMKVLEDADFISPRYPFILSQVVEGSGAAKAGLQVGDRLVSLQGEPMLFFNDYLRELADYSGRTVAVGAERDSAGVRISRVFDVEVSETGKIGAGVDMLALTPVHTRKYTFFQSFPAGVRRTGDEISGYWKQLKMIVKPKTEAYKSLGGPLAIGNIFPSKWNWEHFWSITALLSIVLAIMNILPIPALDGGHVVFLLYEMITRRKPGDKFMMYAQVVGLAILFSLMIYVTWNDISRIFFK